MRPYKSKHPRSTNTYLILGLASILLLSACSEFSNKRTLPKGAPSPRSVDSLKQSSNTISTSPKINKDEGSITTSDPEVVIAELTKHGFNGTLLYTSPDKTILTRAIGVKNAETGEALEIGSKFPIGSVTKTFTSILILQMQEQGLLKTSDTIEKYFPNIAWAPKVSIHHLLTHTSGIYSYTDAENFFEWAENNPKATINDIISLFQNKELKFPPGEKHDYSNSGYILLAKILEQLSSKKYADLLKEKITQPLGMNNTFYDPNYTPEGEAYPHTLGISKSGIVLGKFYLLNWAHAAGGIVSTVEDLLKLNQAIDESTILKKETINKMETPFLDDYAYAVMIREINNQRVVWHTGGLPYYLTYNIRIPEKKSSVIVFTNTWDIPNRNMLAHALMEIKLKGSTTIPKAKTYIDVPESILENYAGSYFSEEISMTFAVRSSEGQLLAKLDKQPELLLRASTTTTFHVPAVGATLEFNTVEQTLTLIQSGQSIVFNRIAPETKNN